MFLNFAYASPVLPDLLKLMLLLFSLLCLQSVSKALRAALTEIRRIKPVDAGRSEKPLPHHGREKYEREREKERGGMEKEQRKVPEGRNIEREGTNGKGKRNEERAR